MGLMTQRAQDGTRLPRITSVRNALLLIHSDDAELVAAITHAIADISA
jgi:hypothetical protein